MKILKKNKLMIETTVGNISNISSGSTPRRDNDSYWNSRDIPWMTSGEVHKGFLYDTENYISIDGWNSIGRKKFPEKTIMMALAGQGKTKGNVCFLEKSVSSNQSLAGIIVDSKNNDPLYVYYILSNMYKEIRNIVGEGREGINIQNIKNIKIKLPVDIEYQQKISYFLRNSEQHIKNIEILLKKIEIRNKYYADKLLSGELTIENNRLVTNNNNKKNQTIKITDHIDIINGYPFKSNEMKNEGKYAVIKMSNFKESKVSTLKNTVYTDNLVNKAQLMKNDLLIGLSGSVGEFAIFNLNEICLLNQRCIILRNKNDDIGDYVKTYIINKVLEDLKNSSEGGVIKNVSSNFFQDMEIILPLEYKEIMLFINKTNEEKEKVEKLLKLEEQRFEWLSDKLLSGEYIIED